MQEEDSVLSCHYFFHVCFLPPEMGFISAYNFGAELQAGSILSSEFLDCPCVKRIVEFYVQFSVTQQ